jgi:hypothetical protein
LRKDVESLLESESYSKELRKFESESEHEHMDEISKMKSEIAALQERADWSDTTLSVARNVVNASYEAMKKMPHNTACRSYTSCGCGRTEALSLCAEFLGGGAK